jgi:carbon storage regulator
MLVLTRKLGQTIVLNNEVEITIVQIKGKQVRIGVKAPKDTSIHRKEVQEEINNGESKDHESK